MSVNAEGYWVGTDEDRRRYRITGDDAANAAVGGEGLVYRATDRFGAAVALKMLTTLGPEDFSRVADRLLPFTEIRHPHLLAHREVFVGSALLADPDAPADFDVLYTVADWVDGDSLVDVRDALLPRERIEILCQIAAGVQAMHDARSAGSPAGLIHRDLKPSNIRIDRDGHAVIIDFGIARPIADTDMTSGAGTYRWKSPEVLRGAPVIGPPADIWGVGAIGYWMFVGEALTLDGAGPARERLRASGDLAELPQPARTATVIARLLESDPDDRPRDLTAWVNALRRTQRHPALRRLATAGAATALVATGTVVVLAAQPDASPTADSSTTVAISVPPTAPTTSAPPPPGAPIELSAKAFPGTVSQDRWNLFAISTDGSLIAGFDTSYNIHAWRTQTFEKIPLEAARRRTPRTISDGKTRSVDLVFSVDGRYLASTDGASFTSIWDTRTGALVNQFETYGFRAGAPATEAMSAFTADNRHLLLLNGKQINAWSVADGTIAATFEVTDEGQKQFSISTSMRHLVTHNRGTLQIRDTSTFRVVATRRVPDVVLHIVDPQGKRWAYATENGVWIVDMRTGEETRVNLRPMTTLLPTYRLVFSPDGTRLAVPTPDQGVRIVDAATGAVLGNTTVANAVVVDSLISLGNMGLSARTLAFQPGGDLVAVPVDTPGDSVLALVNLGPDAVASRQPLEGHSARVNIVSFSPDGQMLASASGDGTIRIWDVASGRTRYVLPGHLDGVSGLSFTPDGRYLVEAKGQMTITQLLRWELPAGTG